MGVAESWAASYRAWQDHYEHPADVARAVVREQITKAVNAHGLPTPAQNDSAKTPKTDTTSPWQENIG